MAVAPLPPFVWKILCGRRLAALRERAGMTQGEVAARTTWGQSTQAAIELGDHAHSAKVLGQLHEIYEPAAEDWAEVSDMAQRGLARPKKSSLRYKFRADTVRQLIDLETSASVTRWHSSMIMPGLLQTESYMRHVFAAYPGNDAEEIERLTELRLERQRVLDNPEQQFVFVIDEAAVSRMSNMADVMREQLWHLVDATERPNVELRFVPFSHGYYLGQADNYQLFEYEVEPKVHVVYVEHYDDAEVLHDGKNVTKYLTLWDKQVQAGLDPNQTRDFMTFLAGRRSP